MQRLTRMDRTCSEIQGFELDDEQKTTACFQLNKEVVCLLQYLLLMVIELRATYGLNIFTPITSLIPQRNIPLGDQAGYIHISP